MANVITASFTYNTGTSTFGGGLTASLLGTASWSTNVVNGSSVTSVPSSSWASSSFSSSFPWATNLTNSYTTQNISIGTTASKSSLTIGSSSNAQIKLYNTIDTDTNFRYLYAGYNFPNVSPGSGFYVNATNGGAIGYTDLFLRAGTEGSAYTFLKISRNALPYFSYGGDTQQINGTFMNIGTNPSSPMSTGFTNILKIEQQMTGSGTFGFSMLDVSALKQTSWGTGGNYLARFTSSTSPVATVITAEGKIGVNLLNPTNSLDVTGNISCSVITASLFYGTASYALSSSGGTPATYTSSLFGTASWAISSSRAISASWAPGVASSTSDKVLTTAQGSTNTYYVPFIVSSEAGTYASIQYQANLLYAPDTLVLTCNGLESSWVNATTAITSAIFTTTAVNSVGYIGTASWAENVSLPAQISVTGLTASAALRVGPSSDAFAHFYISGSSGTKLMEVDTNTGLECFEIRSTGQTYINNLDGTGSLQGTASWARPKITVNSQSYAATFNSNGLLADHFRVTLTGNVTLAKATGSFDGQRLSWEFVQDAGGTRTITLDSAYVTGSDFNVQLCTSASKRDFMTAQYNQPLDKWYVVGFVRNY